MLKQINLVTEDFLLKKLGERKQLDAYRQLRLPDGNVDFCSNDYLGIAKNKLAEQYLHKQAGDLFSCGSTGSRLLTGNYALMEETEKQVAAFHDAPCGLMFNSGYDANTGLLSCVPQRSDTVLYDYYIHASLRDGIRLSFAKAFPFLHNNPHDLKKKIQSAEGNIFVVTESVFSMDGGMAPLEEIADICTRYNAHLIVDEAHATGVVGNKGEGLVQLLKLQDACFARIHTFGKACGAHGAIVLGSKTLKNYLVNFSRPFIYTTALPPACVAAIGAAYHIFPQLHAERQQLAQLVLLFQVTQPPYGLLASHTPIQGIVVPGNSEVKKAAGVLQQNGFDVRPILYPTVPKGEERLRIVLHSFNTVDEVKQLLLYLKNM